MDNTQNKLSVTEAVRQFSDLINRVYYRGESVILTKGNKAVVKINPIKEKPKSTLKTLRKVIDSLPHLSQEEADLFEKDIEEGRKMLLPPKNPWVT